MACTLECNCINVSTIISPFISTLHTIIQFIKSVFIPTLEAIRERGCHTSVSKQSPGLQYLISFACLAKGPYETGSQTLVR